MAALSLSEVLFTAEALLIKTEALLINDVKRRQKCRARISVFERVIVSIEPTDLLKVMPI